MGESGHSDPRGDTVGSGEAGFWCVSAATVKGAWYWLSGPKDSGRERTGERGDPRPWCVGGIVVVVVLFFGWF